MTRRADKFRDKATLQAANWAFKEAPLKDSRRPAAQNFRLQATPYKIRLPYNPVWVQV